MTGEPDIVVRPDNWCHPVFEERLAAEAAIRLVTRSRSSVADALAALADAKVYHVTSTRSEVPPELQVGAALIEQCPRLVCVSTTGAGYDTVDVGACTDSGIMVVNQTGGNARTVAEHTLGLMISLTHRIAELDRRLRAERGFSREDLMGHDLNGKALGLVGLGHVGRLVAGLGRAFGLSVIAYDPYLDNDAFAEAGVERAGTQEALLAAADIVSLHCPLTDETRGMIGAEAFARMRPGAYFVTTARGGIHDEAALAVVLGEGRIAGAGLDVWAQEPPPLDHPLLKLPNVIAGYHTAGVTHEARRTMALIAAEQIVDVLAGRVPPRLVNREVLSVPNRRMR